jgi:hypothetical protein
MSNKTLDLNQIMALKPCGHNKPHDGQNYTRRRVQALLAGRKTITIPEIAAEKTVPPKDRFWLIAKMLTPIQRHELGCRCAERVLHLCDDDPRPRLAIQAKRDWLCGKITLAALHATAADAAAYAAAATTADAATYATYAAAYAAAATTADAAAYATYAAAATTAYVATYAAAATTAYVAAYAAATTAYVAAYAAAWPWQLNQALAISHQTDDEILAGLTATGLTQGDQPHVQ